jgi:hypothetical protein
VFTPSDDTYGFRRAGSSNLAFNRLDGDDVTKLRGETVNVMTDYGKRGEEGPNGCSWKSSGCYAVDGVVYWVVARHIYGAKTGDPARRQTAQKASIIKSTDGGKTWTRTARENHEHLMFPARRFATPYFIQYGQDGKPSVDNADRYVYAISNSLLSLERTGAFRVRRHVSACGLRRVAATADQESAGYSPRRREPDAPDTRGTPARRSKQLLLFFGRLSRGRRQFRTVKAIYGMRDFREHRAG